MFGLLPLQLEIHNATTHQVTSLHLLISHTIHMSASVFREMLDNCTAPKHLKLSSSEHQTLTELLIKKDADLKATVKVLFSNIPVLV